MRKYSEFLFTLKYTSNISDVDQFVKGLDHRPFRLPSAEIAVRFIWTDKELLFTGCPGLDCTQAIIIDNSLCTFVIRKQKIVLIT